MVCLSIYPFIHYIPFILNEESYLRRATAFNIFNSIQFYLYMAISQHISSDALIRVIKKQFPIIGAKLVKSLKQCKPST